ncbi:hypothetical protein EDD86DRAFT_258685 [Gorgonomyces haynaldii]|nr:hypothetical protein EDD86DRAFT_258685 [Gorgonomyces haynaldii]
MARPWLFPSAFVLAMGIYELFLFQSFLFQHHQNLRRWLFHLIFLILVQWVGVGLLTTYLSGMITQFDWFLSVNNDLYASVSIVNDFLETGVGILAIRYSHSQWILYVLGGLAFSGRFASGVLILNQTDSFIRALGLGCDITESLFLCVLGYRVLQELETKKEALSYAYKHMIKYWFSLLLRLIQMLIQILVLCGFHLDLVYASWQQYANIVVLFGLCHLSLSQ